MKKAFCSEAKTKKDFVKEYLLGANSEQGISGNFCGLYFENGYINIFFILL